MTFASSLLFFPNWVNQPEWSTVLTNNIILKGSILLLEGIISWFLSFTFEDSDVKERMIYLVERKNQVISTKLDGFTRQEIEKEKRIRRYIPNIFVESTEIKEKLRYFSEPYLFFEKIVENTELKLKGAYIINVLNQMHFPIENNRQFKIRNKITNTNSLNQKIDLFRVYINQKKQIPSVLIKENGAGLKPEYLSKIPSDYSHLYNYLYPNLQFYYSFEHIIDQAEKDLDLLSNKVLILKGLAGHGKTNLLCDFTENFLLRKKHKCIYLPARELNYIGEQETIEQSISRILFLESKYQFQDIIQLIKFNKRIDFLFLIIDGINEHKNLSLFSTALEQFIQRCSEYNIKIILTCRSEYFDDRFGNLLLIKNSSIIDLDSHENIHNIPDVHQHALISGYFTEFNINLHPDRVHSEIIQKFNEDKLLLRIFSEAYENGYPADYLDDLYKLEIFNRYYEKKIEIIPGLEGCLKEIISWMFEHGEFANSRISNFSSQSIEVIERIVYENVVIRKDIIAAPDIAFGKSEVINFVYDEFRDFLLASNIIILWTHNNSLAREQINQLTEIRTTVSEGLQKYLCLWGIKNDQQDLITFLTAFSWFNLIFIRAVFNSPDIYHSAFVVEIMRNLFFSDSTCALHLIFYLMYRSDIEQHPNLHIDLLLEWLYQVDESKYLSIITPALNMEENYKTSYINYLSLTILEAFKDKKVSDQTTPKLVQLLSYFSGIRDYKYPKYRENGFGQFPAFDAIQMIDGLLNGNLIYEQVQQVNHRCRIALVTENLQRVLDEHGER